MAFGWSAASLVEDTIERAEEVVAELVFKALAVVGSFFALVDISAAAFLVSALILDELTVSFQTSSALAHNIARLKWVVEAVRIRVALTLGHEASSWGNGWWWWSGCFGVAEELVVGASWHWVVNADFAGETVVELVEALIDVDAALWSGAVAGSDIFVGWNSVHKSVDHSHASRTVAVVVEQVAQSAGNSSFSSHTVTECELTITVETVLALASVAKLDSVVGNASGERMAVVSSEVANTEWIWIAGAVEASFCVDADVGADAIVETELALVNVDAAFWRLVRTLAVETADSNKWFSITVETFVAEAMEAFLGVVSDAGGVLMAQVISLVTGIDASVASVKIGTLLLSHAAVLASDTFVDVLASWLAVKRVDARSVAVRVSLVETLEHADIFVSLLTCAGELFSLWLDDRAHASPSARIIDADAVGVNFVSAHERTGSVDTVVVISGENAVASQWIDALVYVEAVGWKAGVVSDVASFTGAESNVLLVNIDGTFSSFAGRIEFSTVHGRTKSKWINIIAALEADSLGDGNNNSVDAPFASSSKVTWISSSGTFVDINAASNAIDSAFSHEASSTAVAVVLVLGGTSDEATEAVESTPVVGS